VAAIAAVMLPIVVVGNIPGFEIVHAMAVVVLGGLVTTTAVALFVVPVLYLRFGFASEPDLWADEHPPAERPEPELVPAKAGEREVSS
jgi:hypothetical protein